MTESQMDLHDEIVVAAWWINIGMIGRIKVRLGFNPPWPKPRSIRYFLGKE